MNFEEAVKAYRQRSLLPEEQVLAEQIAEYPTTLDGHNWLEEALVDLLALDTGDAPPEGMEKPTWQRQIALLDALLTLTREIVEHRVRARAVVGQLTDLSYRHNQVVAELRGTVA